MTNSPSGAFVFFGATGDLAYKKIFPALQTMVKRGTLDVPVIGVARSPWSLDQFRARAYDSIEKHGGVDRAAFEKLSSLLHYMGGRDYHDPATHAGIRNELGASERPAFYLAIPPALFGLVVEQLGTAGFASKARVIVEKPFGTDLASARALNAILLGGSTKEAFSASIITSASGRSIASYLRALRIRSCKSPWQRISESRAAAGSTIRPARFATSCRTISFRF